MPNKIDLKGKVIYFLTVIEENGRRQGGGVLWLCKCVCGNFKTYRSDDLINKKRKSCGKCRRSKSISHGLCNTSFYIVWQGMQARCNNKNNDMFQYYGGKNIQILWKSFDEFKQDMYESYLAHVKKYGEKQTTIDRIDNDGDYCKENCRWVTHFEQVCNRRKQTKKCTSVFKGVVLVKRGKKKWRAGIYKNHQFNYLGIFNTEQEAAHAYNEKAKELFGEYAFLNKL